MFGGLCFSLFYLVAGFMISAPSSQPGKELGSCRQGKTSWKRHRSLNKEIAWGEREGMKPVSHKTLFPSAAGCVGGREGAGRGRNG